MLFLSFMTFIIYVSYFVHIIACVMFTKYDKNGDKLVLNPIELIDLILEERLRNEIPSKEQRHKAGGKLTGSQLRVEEATKSVAIDEDGDSELWPRKVWSRWSKWSECSATCGAGAMERRRLCVAGRCAPGEREQQRRPCLRPPCVPANNEEHPKQ